MRLKYLWIIGALTFTAACGPNPNLHVPQGDPEAGRETFAELGCHGCHQVRAENFPRPVAVPPVPVVLGAPMNKKSRTYLAESILAPSHQLAEPPSEIVTGLVIIQRQYPNIQQGDYSRMGDYTDVLTVREWLDLVAYLEAMQERPRNEVQDF